MQLKNTKIKVPRLGISRFGVYYLRCSVQDATGRRKVIQHSLKTKDAAAAKWAALRFSLSLIEGEAMTQRQTTHGHTATRYEIDIERGLIKSDGPEDHERAMTALDAMARAQALRANLAAANATTGELAPVHGRAQSEPLAGTEVSSAEPANRQGPVPPLTQDQAWMGKVVAPAVALTPGRASHVEPAHPVADVQTGANPGRAGPAVPAQVHRLKDALYDHLQEERRQLKSGAGTFEEKRSIFQEFLDFFGDIPLNDITPEQIAGRWRPAEFNRPNGKIKGQLTGMARLEKRRGYLHKFFDWAKNHRGYPHPNPLSVKMASKKTIRRDANPHEELNHDDLRKLYSAQYRDRMEAPDWYWLPLIGLYSAARLGEIAELTLDNFEVIEGHKVMRVTDSKTGAKRLVPVHSALIELGLWEYVEALRARGCTRLLPHRPLRKPEKMAGRMWGIWVNACGLGGQHKTFHSLRVTAITDLHNASANGAGIHRVSGHATQAVQGTHGQYVRSIALKVTAQTVESLSYQPLNLSDLRREDPTFKAFFDNVLAPQYGGDADGAKAKREKHLAAKAEREQRMQRGRGRQTKPSLKDAPPGADQVEAASSVSASGGAGEGRPSLL